MLLWNIGVGVRLKALKEDVSMNATSKSLRWPNLQNFKIGVFVAGYSPAHKVLDGAVHEIGHDALHRKK